MSCCLTDWAYTRCTVCGEPYCPDCHGAANCMHTSEPGASDECLADICAECAQEHGMLDNPRCWRHGGPLPTGFTSLPPEVQQRALTLAKCNAEITGCAIEATGNEDIVHAEAWGVECHRAHHWPQVTSFEWEGVVITDPFTDESTIVPVDPVRKYGLAFLQSPFCELARWEPPAGQSPGTEAWRVEGLTDAP